MLFNVLPPKLLGSSSATIPSVLWRQIHIPHDVVTIPPPPDAFETFIFLERRSQANLCGQGKAHVRLPHTDLPVTDRDDRVL